VERGLVGWGVGVGEYGRAVHMPEDGACPNRAHG
jgi:hypothetical protein